MLRVGLIGAGRWGQRYVQVFERLRDELDASLVLVRADGIRTPALDRPALDGLIVATPPVAHEALTAQAIKAGLSVLVEKPATLDLASTLRLLDLARSAQGRVMVGHQHLFAPAFAALVAQIGQSAVTGIESAGYGSGPQRDYSALWDWAPHDLAMTFAVLGVEHAPVLRAAFKEERDSGSAWKFDLDFDGTAAEFMVGNVFAARRRRFRVTTVSHDLLYDDHATDKLTDRGAPIVVGSDLPLDLQVGRFLAMCAEREPDWRDLELSASIARVLEQVETTAVETTVLRHVV